MGKSAISQRITLAMSGASLFLALSLPIFAQAPSSKPVAVPAPPAQPKKIGIVTLDSVSQQTLAQYVNQPVKAQGIIGNYIGDKTRYSFAMDNGSAVQVVGAFPDTGGARWTLTGRVVQEGSKYILSEVSKEPVGDASSSGGLKFDPLLLAGGLLIVAALVTFGVMTARSKAARQREQLDQQLEEERRRADAARAEADRARMSVERGAGVGGPGGTVVAGADGSAPLPRANTIISIGSVEAVTGPQTGQKFPLQTGETRIGRAKDRSVAVLLDKDGEVSNYHGSIVVTMDGRMLYKDESTNGSIVDSKPVHHSQVELHSGSQVEVGGTTLKVTLRLSPTSVATSSPAASIPAPVAGVSIAPRSAPTIALDVSQPAPKAPAAPTMAGYGAEFEAVEGPETGRHFAIVRPITTIGREDRDILLSEESISRAHSTLTVQDGTFVLADSGSSHGTRVNNEPITLEGRALLDGDRIALGNGRTILVFHRIGG